MRKLNRLEILVALVCNYFTPLQILAAIAAGVWLPGWGWKTGGVLFVVYLLPVLCVRTLLAISPLPVGSIPIGSAKYYVWWFAFCAQNLYARFPVLEEAIRCIPGCYSLWLRLWGAKIGKLTYWCAGTRIYDRFLLQVGDHCRFGFDVKIVSHVHIDNVLRLGPVVIEDNVVVGANSLLTAGTVLKAGQSTKSFLISPPGSIWQDNRRISK